LPATVLRPPASLGAPERNLDDGAQQRLVSLALKLRAAQAAVPPGLGGQLDEAVADCRARKDAGMDSQCAQARCCP